MIAQNPSSVEVKAYARLHFGFLDLHGGLGRRFGSIGLPVDGFPVDSFPVDSFHVRVRAEPAETLRVTGAEAERAAAHARTVLDALRSRAGAHVHVESTMPAHAGLGSGTQLALAVGTALCRLFGHGTEPAELADWLGRGKRSGIGIGGFAEGGLIVDGGKGERSAPPVIMRLPFPEDWRFLLVLDEGRQGLSGAPERHAFEDMPAMPERDAERLCRQVLMRLLPALCERDIQRFGQALDEVQEVTGKQFAPYQQGMCTSPAVEESLRQLRRNGACACGQSSWGPTGFALFPDEAAADQALRQIRQESAFRALRFVRCRGRNQPAEQIIE